MKDHTKKFIGCNHHHKPTKNHCFVDFGDGGFIANKEAMPLLSALHALGLKTRTHHVDKNGGFISILLEDGVDAEMKVVNEIASTRTKYNGKKELLIQWQKPNV